MQFKKNNINIPGGVSSATTGSSKEIIIRTIGEYQDVEDVEDTVIRANSLGRSIRGKRCLHRDYDFCQREISL